MNELSWGVYLGVVSNLAVAAVLNNTVFDADGRAWLVTLGAWNELLGVLYVASPELLPRIHRAISALGSYVSAGGRWMAASLKSLLPKQAPSPQTVKIGLAVELDTAGKITAHKGTIYGADLSQQVEFLLRRTSEHEGRVGLIEPELKLLREAITAASREVREEFLREQSALERRLADQRIMLRLLGLSYVVLGLVLSFAGNLVGV